MRRLLSALALVAALVAPTLVLAGADAGDAQRQWSTIPDGPYRVLAATAHNFTASDGTHISYAVHMPDVPAGTRVPVILSAGPYFDLLEEPVTLPSSFRLTGFLIDNFVSHGYAVVAASVRGTGWSGGCMELFSEREGRDLDELVTFLANEPWSDGNVGMTGKSYDGGMAWSVARFGNPHLKTIVPIASVPDAGDLQVHNGVAETRTAIFHPVVYYPYGFGLSYGSTNVNEGRSIEDRAANALCPELAKSLAIAPYSVVTGDTQTTPVVADYWAERNFKPGTIANYEGSVFVVHGLRDYNTNPSQVVPFFSELPQEKKMWLGQWAHHYADEGAATNRPDFAGVLKAWFDRHLKGMSVDTGPIVEVADVRGGTWRSYGDWPSPTGAVAFGLRGDQTMSTAGGDEFERVIATPGGLHLWGSCTAPRVGIPFSQPIVYWDSDGMLRFTTTTSQTMRLSGIATVDVEFDPATSGNVIASLCVNDQVVTRGGTNMLYGDGTNEIKPYVPGLPTTVRVELEPQEVTIPAGSRVTLTLAIDDWSYDNVALSSGVAVLTGGTLTLPLA